MEALLRNSGLFWFLAGIFLMFTEFLIPGFIIFFFGLGAIITAILSWLGILNSIDLQIIVFIVSSLLTLVLFRNKGKKYFKGRVRKADVEESPSQNIIGEKVIVSEEINPAKLTGKVELHGTMWNATSGEVIHAGESVEITGRKDLTLIVKKV
jgi:membrane protein implicated in regulation of membrane protease activity